MRHKNYYYPHRSREINHPGIMGAFGGIINLTTATLYGGAKIVRNIVEGSVWHGCDCGHANHGRCDCCHRVHHKYHVKCLP